MMKLRDLLKIIGNLFLALFFGWLFLSPAPKNSSRMDSVVQTIGVNRGGGTNEPTTNSVGSLKNQDKLSSQVPKDAKNIPNVKVEESSSLSSERIRYSPNGNDSGAGGDNDPSSCSDQWICPKIPEPNEVISDNYFWEMLEKGKFDEEDSEDITWDDEDWIEPEQEQRSFQSNQRRRLMSVPSPTPTGKLDKQNTKKFDFTTGPIPKITYRHRDGRVVSMLNKPVKKIVYSHAPDLGIFNLANRIECPIQSDPNKFQRTDCFAITDQSVRDVIIKVFELTTYSDPTRYVTLKMPMPFYKNQNTIAYLDKITGECIYSHENGDLWSAKRYSSIGVDKLLNDPNVIQNP